MFRSGHSDIVFQILLIEGAWLLYRHFSLFPVQMAGCMACAKDALCQIAPALCPKYAVLQGFWNILLPK